MYTLFGLILVWFFISFKYFNKRKWNMDILFEDDSIIPFANFAGLILSGLISIIVLVIIIAKYCP